MEAASRINKKATGNWTYDAASLTTVITVPKRGKNKPVTVTAVAKRGIVALGDDHNRAVIRADVARLLGEPISNATSDDLAAILALDAPGKLDAVARLGGPFARIIPFTTPEEATQQLGRVIVGAPAEGSYDLSVNFTLNRGGQTTQDTIAMQATTGSHIIDTPFAWKGEVVPTQWSAEVALTWRGETLTTTFQSDPLFPTIPAWRYVAFTPTNESLALDQVMSPAGSLKADVEWTPHIQTHEDIKANLSEAHDLILARIYRQQLMAGQKFAAYVATTITSPDARECALNFWYAGVIDLYWNGQKLDLPPKSELETELAPFFRPTRTIEGLALREGANTLVAALRPCDDVRSADYPYWGIGAQIIAPDGSGMPDLGYA